ncbi:MAG: hypothetical protein JSR66_24140 [Proteobacteria bacterium]|nr:hypothetical protein [Pseudomonadota bacterium]
MTATWRSDVDSFCFTPSGHAGLCFVHRRAFATILGFDPTPEDCAACFRDRGAAFEAAAAAKINRSALAAGAHFHLNSRDILRATV